MSSKLLYVYGALVVFFLIFVVGVVINGRRIDTRQADRIEEQLDHDETVEALAECQADNAHLWEQLAGCFSLRGDFCSVPPDYLQWWQDYE
jgi:hypothetical protein